MKRPSPSGCVLRRASRRTSCATWLSACDATSVESATSCDVRVLSRYTRTTPTPKSAESADYGCAGVKFFLPDWDDRVDPGFDFLTDRPSLKRDPYRDDLYAHELLPGARLYDGILVSRMAL